MVEDLKRSVAELMKFIDDIKAETDRAAVILAASKIDYLLSKILLKFLIPNPSGKDDLLDADSPLNSFSARINMVYRLGLITKDFSRALHILRRIRNQFAHEYSNSKLNSSPHRDRVQEFIYPFFDEEYEKNKTLFVGEGDDIAIDFKFVVATISLRLEKTLAVCEPRKDDKAIPLIIIK